MLLFCVYFYITSGKKDWNLSTKYLCDNIVNNVKDMCPGFKRKLMDCAYIKKLMDCTCIKETNGLFILKVTPASYFRSKLPAF